MKLYYAVIADLHKRGPLSIKPLLSGVGQQKSTALIKKHAIASGGVFVSVRDEAASGSGFHATDKLF